MRTTAIRTTSYSLPAHLHDHIDVVQPTNFFPSGRPLLSSLIVDDGSFNQQSGPAPAPVPQPNMSLPELKTLYRTDAYKAKGTRSSIGITEKLYKLKYDFFYRPALKSTLHVELINGAINSQNISEAGIEANLDVQFAGGISVSYLTSAQWGFRATQSPLEICFDGSTLSSKYIWSRPNTNRSISYEDNGNEPYDVFLTYLLRKKTKDLPQVLTTSYGEDEDTVPINYARRVCKLYAALGTRGISALHASGDGGVGCVGETGACFTPNRGYRYPIVYQWKVIRVSGTSASTPTFAAIIALLNDALLSKGRGPLGFLAALYMGSNPWIYTLRPGILNDITTGSNPGCGTTGFNATRGWDPATGFGTPDLPRLLKALKL
ncbi:peptidase S8/S53 domain-containing protein [Cantharellus anzutake]|uniref:peptidase S8/S53 domain-containing protein n=1 Tax=Cantharellus anzutake TaxID=1750568 RepID=UPI0019051C5D|nr:peptidase S8/S53 domain-containing protein [Cantharellus anzutake]KAF8339518.1 peptidase S8/S53 domain-containing protein [Cantharellus anzutake]